MGSLWSSRARLRARRDADVIAADQSPASSRAVIASKKEGEGLREIEVPSGTRSWKPVSHAELVEAIESELDRRGLTIQSEAYAVQRKGALLFA